MPKSLSLGNGNILVLFDKYAQVHDFYFPNVGLEDHVAGSNVHKVGVWVENQFSWFDGGEWEINIDYGFETMASKIIAKCPRLELELEFVDLVYNEKNIFLRKVAVKNLAPRDREIKVFFNQQFYIYESSRGNTAYFEPVSQTIIHYKGRRVFVIGGRMGDQSFDDYSIGLQNIEGKEGTFKDAEDGYLAKNAIEHGPIDSVIGFTVSVSSQNIQTFSYWITAAEDIREALNLHYYVLEKNADHLFKTTQSYWRAWVNKYDFNFHGLDESIVRFFKKSLLIIRTHVDNRGAIIASGDSEMLKYGRDTYSYMWPRDGAFTALALDRAGYFDLSKKFFEFCNEIIGDEGFLLHKYRADKSLGSSWHPWIKNGKRELAIQEDETALVLVALWEHYRFTRDLEFIESIYNSFIKKAGEFLVRYRDPETKLPQSSYDLWEQKFGTSTYTAASVYGALIAAANFSKLLEKGDDQARYFKAAQEVKEGICRDLYNSKNNFFYKQLIKQDNETIYDDTIDASSFYGLFKFAVLDIGDDRLNKAYKLIEDKLRCKTEIGGIARYLGDNYYQTGNDIAGNPWFVTTLWMSQYDISRAQNEADLEKVKQVLKWVVDHAFPSGILSEQINPYTGEHLSVAPLIWSQAEFVFTVIQYLEKLENLGICETCNPVR